MVMWADAKGDLGGNDRTAERGERLRGADAHAGARPRVEENGDKFSGNMFVGFSKRHHDVVAVCALEIRIKLTLLNCVREANILGVRWSLRQNP